MKVPEANKTTSRCITVHSRTGIRTHHTGNSTTIHSSCAASIDYHRTACYSDCKSTATIVGPPSLSAQPTSYVVVDDQQPGTSRQMIFNPPSVAPSQQEESQHNTSGLSSRFTAISSVLTYQQMDTPPPPVPSFTHHEHSRPPSQSSQQSKSAQISGLARTSRTKPGPFQGHPNCPKTIIKLHVCAPKQKKHTVQHLHLPTVQKKIV